MPAFDICESRIHSVALQIPDHDLRWMRKKNFGQSVATLIGEAKPQLWHIKSEVISRKHYLPAAASSSCYLGTGQKPGGKTFMYKLWWE